MLEFRYCCGRKNMVPVEIAPASRGKLDLDMSAPFIRLRNTVSGVVTEFTPEKAERLLKHPTFSKVLEVVREIRPTPKPAPPRRARVTEPSISALPTAPFNFPAEEN